MSTRIQVDARDQRQTTRTRTDDAASAAAHEHGGVIGGRSSHDAFPLASPQQLRTLDRALVQFRASIRSRAATTADYVQAAAAEGTSGAAGVLPYVERIQASFGRHDVSGMRAHTGSEAVAATAAMGAHAYASGQDVVLGEGGTDLHTVAHEAAHVVQQRGGVQLEGGVGQAGDRYERHADAVADKVVRGESAEGLLDQMAGARGATAGSGAVQRQHVSQPLGDDATWEDLERQAQEALPKFSDIVDQLIERTGASTETYEKTRVHEVDNPTGKGGKVRRYEQSEENYSGVAPLKGQARAEQKADGKYDGRLNRVLDVVRATLTFEDFTALIGGMYGVMQHQEELGYEVVRCKQTYTPVHMSLYGDIKMNVREASTGHVCELQFTVTAFMDAKQKGHKPYREMREANPMGDSMSALHDTADAKTFAQAQRAVHGSYAAYLKARQVIEKDGMLEEAIEVANELGEAIKLMQE